MTASAASSAPEISSSSARSALSRSRRRLSSVCWRSERGSKGFVIGYLLTLRDLQRSPEASGGIVRLGTVVIHEDVVITAITKDRATEFPNVRRCFHPA